MSTRRVASATSELPHAPKNSPLPPKVPVPSERTGTRKPERPRVRCSMRANRSPGAAGGQEAAMTDASGCAVARIERGDTPTDQFRLERRIEPAGPPADQLGPRQRRRSRLQLLDVRIERADRFGGNAGDDRVRRDVARHHGAGG